MNKTLNEAAIVNELKGQSLFFPQTESRPDRAQSDPPPPSPTRPSDARPRLDPPAEAAPAAVGAPRTADAPAPLTPVQPPDAAPTGVDLSELPTRKDTFMVTNDEFEAFEDLKLTLRRTLDVKVTKNDLARCALAYLVEDCRRHGSESVVIQPLTRRRGR